MHRQCEPGKLVNNTNHIFIHANPQIIEFFLFGLIHTENKKIKQNNIAIKQYFKYININNIQLTVKIKCIRKQ